MWSESGNSHKIAIDGRDDFQELNWYNPAVHEAKPRPGPGMLPPLLADEIHDPEHALYSVNVMARLPSTTPDSAQLAPSQEEARMAIPHARSYYCAEYNGWVLILWGSSSVLPPLARTVENLPDAARRKGTTSCIGDGEQPFAQVNATHHWHRYERAVDSRNLSTPFRHEEETPRLLDLYLCCQCSKYCMVSDVLPGVIPHNVHQAFTHDKWSHPPPDRTPKGSVMAAWETMLTILENRLWKDEQRSLPVTRPRFQHKLGWNNTVRNIFELLGFPAIKKSTATTANMSSAVENLSLQPPNIDPATPEGKHIRAKLLRAWVEISAWLAIYRKSKGDLGNYSSQVICVDATDVREMYQEEIGAHVKQIPRGLLPNDLVNLGVLDDAWRTLGMTPSSYTWELLGFAYQAQCRCDPLRTPLYFTKFCQIVQMLANVGKASPPLQQLIHDERKRHRYTFDDLRDSIALLGFGQDDGLGVEFDGDRLVLDAWRNARRRTWTDPERGGEMRMRLNAALKIIADTRNRRTLESAWDRAKGSMYVCL
ncbi:uncharacterized protein B0H18DRAFT_691434 [Fomitopsis serialis]|uniref:uncharacterized protein n=1 Tax=Fomitopsis serialis TaxID=139415 RepID=UPI0020076AB8|nr:uncharacterized protein B0H18DRAFT_691434 [Neoantrodia serialis]KAH9917622.1 hypothetical protein B0H18DRAFT_691434 [Neoantrodia serialis]